MRQPQRKVFPDTWNASYCHLACKERAKPWYADCGYLPAIIVIISTAFTHASTIRSIHQLCISSDPTYPPTYRCPQRAFTSRFSTTNTASTFASDVRG